MENLSFEELLNMNCFSDDQEERRKAADLLEKNYGCEIHCPDMGRSVRFAHHARGCTIVAAKLSEGVIIYQNVTLGSNMKYNRETKTWENVGSPVLGKNVIVADGAKILGPVVIGDNTVIGAGAIITKDIPADSVAYGVNHYRPKDPKYDLIFGPDMPSGEDIIKTDAARVAELEKQSL